MYMQPAQLPAVMQIQALAYAGLPVLEPLECFASRQRLAPDGCQVVLDHGEVAGYLFSHPWDAGPPPSLGAPLTALPASSGYWFIHDCAVNPAWQGRGVARRLLAAAMASARRHQARALRLVSLGAARGFWQQQGFQPAALAAASGGGTALQARLAHYGQGACLMQRLL